MYRVVSFESPFESYLGSLIVQIQGVPVAKTCNATPMFLGCKAMLECLNIDSHSTKNGDHIQEMVLGCSWFEYHNSRSFLVEKKREITPSLLIKSTMCIHFFRIF